MEPPIGVNFNPGVIPQPQAQPSAPPSPAPNAPQANAPQANGSQTSGGVDRDALRLSRAIMLQEGGGKPAYNAAGKSGEWGAGQWMPGNYAAMAKQFGFDPNDKSPQTQDQIVYHQVLADKQAGLQPAEIAAKWNSGNPNNWENHSGVNPEGVHYDTPGYVKNVQKYYNQLAQQEGSNTQAGPEQASMNRKSDPGLTGIGPVDAVANFLFPIAGDLKNDVTGQSSKSALQQVGDAGLSALPFIPGLGAAGEGAGLLTKLLAGGAIGYGAGALGNLSQGQDIGHAISPNLGTIGGAATGGIANAVLPKLLAPFSRNLTARGAQLGTDDAVQNVVRSKQTTIKWLQDNFADKGAGGMEKISRVQGLLPDIEEQGDKAIINSTKQIDRVKQLQNTMGQVRAAAMTKMGVQIPIDDIEKEGMAQLDKTTPAANKLTRPGAETQFASDIAHLRATYGESISPQDAQDIKEFYSTYGDKGGNNPNISVGAKSALEKAAQSADAPDLKVFNREYAKLYDAEKILTRINGQVAKGGVLRRTLRGHAVGLAAGAASQALGGGFLGDVGGFLGGEAISHMLSKMTAGNTFASPLSEAILERMSAEDPEVVANMSRYAGMEGQVIPQRQVGPPNAAGGIMRKLMLTSAARAPGMATSPQ